MGSDIDQENFHGETPYNLMFGPDICGPGLLSSMLNQHGSHLIKNHL
jgi:hypothetical protein